MYSARTTSSHPKYVCESPTFYYSSSEWDILVLRIIGYRRVYCPLVMQYTIEAICFGYSIYSLGMWFSEMEKRWTQGRLNPNILLIFIDCLLFPLYVFDWFLFLFLFIEVRLASEE